MLVKCPECGKEVSDQAQSCPGCGYEPVAVDRLSSDSKPGVKRSGRKPGEVKMEKGCLKGCLIFVLISILIGFIGTCVTDKKNNDVSASVEVSASQYANKWPLKAKSGKVYCIKNAAVFATYDTPDKKLKLYALNGIALNSGYPDIAEIQLDNPMLKGCKMDIQFLIDLANKTKE